MKILLLFFLGVIIMSAKGAQYTVDIDKSYVECITGCLVKEQTCNNLVECAKQKQQYLDCSLKYRDYCLISTPSYCNQACLTFTPTEEFQSYLQCRLKCFSPIIQIFSLLGLLIVSIILNNI